MKNKLVFPFLFIMGIVLTSCGTSLKSLPITGVKYSEVRKANDYKADLPSVGEPKVLVIPVDFSDYTCSIAAKSSNKDCESIKDDIELSFFGESDEMYWESLSSFYEKSSYGKLKIQGKVTDWYRANYTTIQMTEKDDNGVSVLREAVEWARANSDDNLQEFDTDNDGFIDAVELIYACPMNYYKPGMNRESSIFWAFTFWDGNGPGANKEKPNAYSFVWQSVEFMYENAMHSTVNEVVMPDAHTFIHETGHLLNAPDYYTYDNNDWGAAGALDMMDHNIGDHNAYSKANYGWITPIIPDKGQNKITLRPFESSGDALLLTPEWNGTLMDEYLILEYYTPTGLNKLDSIEQFAGKYPLMFSEAGIKVYHVDSRLAKFKYNRTSGSYEFLTYTSLFTGPSSSYETITRVGNSNTASRSAVPENKLLHLLESSGENSFAVPNSSGRYSNVATNETLWKEGMTFGMEGGPFSAFTFNNTKMVGKISFEVLSINEKGATISFNIG